jgi:hypothetical protein
MEKVYQVFVSSTFSDLEDERKKVSDTLAKAGFIPSGMELFPATSLKQLEFIKKVIDRCDYYVVIVAARYGSMDGDKSFTEKEFEYALSKGLPVLAFIHKDSGKIASEKSETDPKQIARLEAFRCRLKDSRIVYHWIDVNDLCMNVLVAVTSEVTLSPGVGWVRGDQAIDPKLLQELERLRVECSELRERISRAGDFGLTFPPDIKGPDEPFACDLIVRQLEAQPEVGAVVLDRKVIDTKIIPVIRPLRELFVSISDFILVERSEHELKSGLGRAFAAVTGIRDDRNFMYEVAPQTLRDLRYQLQALGLIESGGGKSIGGLSYICWNITDKGKQYVSYALAQRKQPN